MEEIAIWNQGKFVNEDATIRFLLMAIQLSQWLELMDIYHKALTA